MSEPIFKAFILKSCTSLFEKETLKALWRAADALEDIAKSLKDKA